MYAARDLFAGSQVAREAFGQEVVDHYLNRAQGGAGRVRSRGHGLGEVPWLRAAVSRPVIGICSATEVVRWRAWEMLCNLSPRTYADAVQAAGALAILLPPDDAAAEEPDEALDLIDGLVLAGGADVDPGSYGARPHAETHGTWPERDRFELALAHRALERDMPVLGICRGMQMLNVALGGTLDQHLPDAVGHQDHRRTCPAPSRDHEVRLDPGSLAARAVGCRVERGQVASPPGHRRAGRGAAW